MRGAAGDPDELIRALLLSRHGERMAGGGAIGGGRWQAGDLAAISTRPDYEYIGPLVYDTARRLGYPQAALDELAAVYHAQASRTMRRLHEAGLAVAALEQAGIPSLVLKGAALAETVYGNVALRPMRDVDLLVRPDDASRAVACLVGLGYAPLAPGVHRDLRRQFEQEITLVKDAQPGLSLDVHWSLLESPFYQRPPIVAWLWTTAVPCRLGGHPARMLGPEAQLLHLCAHMVLHHSGNRILWSYDVVNLLWAYHQLINWHVLLTRARDFALLLPLKQTLPALASQWRAPLPDNLLRELEAIELTRRERRLTAWLAAPRRQLAHRYINHLVELPGWPARIRFLAAQLFPSPAYMRYRYHIRWSQSRRPAQIAGYGLAYLGRLWLGLRAIGQWLPGAARR